MKKKQIVYSREQARIYRHYYRWSWNPLLLLRTVAGILFSGSSPAGSSGFPRR